MSLTHYFSLDKWAVQGVNVFDTLADTHRNHQLEVSTSIGEVVKDCSRK